MPHAITKQLMPEGAFPFGAGKSLGLRRANEIGRVGVQATIRMDPHLYGQKKGFQQRSGISDCFSESCQRLCYKKAPVMAICVETHHYQGLPV